MVIVDTNIIIDHLRRKKESLLEKINQQFKTENISVSVITVQELYAGESTKRPDKEKELLLTLSPLKILPYTYDIAQLAGEIERDLDRPLELADAAIAATAIINGDKLYTLNKKDYQKIDNLELL